MENKGSAVSLSVDEPRVRDPSSDDVSSARPWRPVESYDGPDGCWNQVDLWMAWGASPLTMGMADAFRVADAWREDGKWFHKHDGAKAELAHAYITHWMPKPRGPNGERAE